MPEFEALYNEYYNRIYAFLYKICRDREICEDMTQEAFSRHINRCINITVRVQCSRFSRQ